MTDVTDHDRIVALERDMLELKSLKRTLLLAAPCAVFSLIALLVVGFMVTTSERLGYLTSQVTSIDQRLTRIETLLLERLPAPNSH